MNFHCFICTFQSTQGRPPLSLPPSPWMDDLSPLPGHRSRSASSPSKIVAAQATVQCKTKIETEFPATPSSPKMKHISVTERAKTQRSASTSSLQGRPKTQKLKSSSSCRSKIAQPLVSKSVSNVTNQKELTLTSSTIVGVASTNSCQSAGVKKSLSHPDNIDKVSVSSSTHSKVTSRAVKVQASGTVTPVKTCSATVGSGIPVKRASKSQPVIPQSSNSSSQTKIPTKNLMKSERNLQDSNLKRSISPHGSNANKTQICHKINTQQAKNSSSLPLKQVAKLNSMNKPGNNTTGPIEISDSKVSPIEKESSTISQTVPLLPKAQYFYDYSDEDSDFNQPISNDFSVNSITSLNELLEGDDTDTLLDEDITAETFRFFESPTFIETSKPCSKDDSVKNLKAEKRHKRVMKSSSLGSKPDIVKDTIDSEMKHHSKSPHMGRRKLSLTYQGKRKSQGQRPNSLILAREKHFSYQDYHSTSSLSSTDSDENWSPSLERKCHPRHKGGRKSSSSSNRSSYHSSVSEKQSHKSSQELAPVAMEIKKSICSTSSDTSSVSRENTLKQSRENGPDLSNSVENLNSSLRKKGPPPPIAKKPMSGKKSPGIRMGIQSPGFRQNKPSQYSYVGKDANSDKLILKPHEFKMDTSTTCVQDVAQTCHVGKSEIKIASNKRQIVSVDINSDTKNIINGQIGQKYVSSDSSFEGKNLDKVERSGSKDDGYSTMSSDIQPEAMEKFSDASLNKTDTLTKENSNLNSAPSSPKVLSVKNSTKSSPEISSDLDSFIGSSTVSSDFKMSSSTSSFSSVKSPKSPNPSEDRAVKFGSLGRVKAMKMLFEAENQNSENNMSKFSKFPLRKSPSVDSSLGSKPSIADLGKLKRRSLGDDVCLVTNDEPKEIPTQTRELKVTTETIEKQQISKQEERKKFEPQHRPTLKPSIPEKLPSFQPLHLSEENFLSDIPEEKDEYDISSHSSASHLEVFRYHHQMSKHLELLNMFRLRTNKKFWSSTQGLSRAVKEVDDNQFHVFKAGENISLFLSVDKSSFRPLDRSMSLGDLHKTGLTSARVKMLPRLRRPWNISLDEVRIMEQVQSIVKSHLLQQVL